MNTLALARRPRVLRSVTYHAATLLGTAYITVTEDEAGAPTEAFVNIAKAGSDTFAVAEAMGRLVSLILRMPSTLSRRDRAEQIVEQLSRVGGTAQPVRPLPDAVPAVLAEHLKLPDPRARADVLAMEQPEMRVPTSVAALAAAPAPTPGRSRSKAARTGELESLKLSRTDKTKGPDIVSKLRPELKHAARTLGQALTKAPALRAYGDSSAALEADRSATTLLDELERLQADIRVRQSNGTLSQADITRLRDLQSQVQAHPTIVAFIEAQQEATAYLPQVNQEISQLLGIDFALLAAPASC